MPIEERRLAEYEILGKLGQGGMGVVYRARHGTTGELVAIKVLPRHLWRDDDARGRFLLEAILSSTLEHPNIARFLGSDETPDGGLYLVNELCHGQTLQSLLRRQLPTPAEALDVAAQTAEGLAAAHAKGIIHRDVKPSNLMLSSGWEVKILDFGLARLEIGDGLTKRGEILGTATYGSPEQMRGDEVDPRTDIWSLGAVLYEMLAGRVPFSGASLEETRNAVLARKPAPLPAELPLRTELQRILDSTLAKSPDDRSSDAGTLAAELRRARSALEPASATTEDAREEPSRRRGLFSWLGR